MTELFSEQKLFEIILLLLGLIIFIMGVIIIFVYLKQDRPLTIPIVLFLISILMIGFPAIEHFKLNLGGEGFEFELNKKGELTIVETRMNT